MNTAHLIAQLLEIEQAIGKLEPARIRGMLFEAEESILQIEQHLLEILVENESLRLRLDNGSRPSSLANLSLASNVEKFSVN
jgi:hypothetical protein